ncbi:MAG: superoxide dismutase, Ni [Candidatus Heimdallarchaeota archaeon]
MKKILGIEKAYAHCDVPCGIYDPHLAQVSAHTVVRMVQLMNSLEKDDPDYGLKMSRYINVKEEHGELLKHEVRIIWGDFLKPDHANANPGLTELVWDIMRHGSAGRQTADMSKAQGLLEATLKFSELFWKVKGVTTKRVDDPYPSGGQMFLPV